MSFLRRDVTSIYGKVMHIHVNIFQLMHTITVSVSISPPFYYWFLICFLFLEYECSLFVVFIFPCFFDFFGAILGAACSLEYVAVPELRGGSGERERHLYHVPICSGWWLRVIALWTSLFRGGGEFCYFLYERLH